MLYIDFKITQKVKTTLFKDKKPLKTRLVFLPKPKSNASGAKYIMFINTSGLLFIIGNIYV